MQSLRLFFFVTVINVSITLLLQQRGCSSDLTPSWSRVDRALRAVESAANATNAAMALRDECVCDGRVVSPPAPPAPQSPTPRSALRRVPVRSGDVNHGLPQWLSVSGNSSVVTEWHAWLATKGFAAKEGHVGDDNFLAAQTRYYCRLAGLPFVHTICEIGYNMGHSAMMWLACSARHVRLISFDLRPDLQHMNETSAEVARRHPGRFDLIYGNSLESVPQFHREQHAHNCSILHVDVSARAGHLASASLLCARILFAAHDSMMQGGHSYAVSSGDLANMRVLADPNMHILLMDDTPCNAFWCVNLAWNEAVQRGDVAEADRISINSERGFSVGRYIM